MKLLSTFRARMLFSHVLAVSLALAAAACLLARSGVPAHVIRSHAPAVLAAAVLLALAVGWITVSLSGRQFGEIVAGSKKFASGDFGYRIPVGSSGELKKLSETLNFMAGEADSRMREVQLGRLEVEAAFRDMSEAIVMTDGSGVITRMNPRARQLMGVKGFNPEGMRLSGMPGGGELSSAAIKALSSVRPVSFEFEPASAPGTTLAVSASPILQNAGVSGCVLVARDVTAARRLEDMRRDFVANVSHELKTPLTAIKGCAETLLGGALADPEHGPVFARSIHEQALRLENLVDDLLKISYSESGRVRVEKVQVDLKALTEDAARAAAPAVAAKKISFKNLIPEGLPASADGDKISQVLINLLDNAAKYNRDGGEIRVYAVRAEGGVKVTVEDTGPGIAAEHLSRIFERFYRVDKARSRELGGTGLGLSIVKHLVELHGGSAGVESAVGRGSAFWFTLPD